LSKSRVRPTQPPRGRDGPNPVDAHVGGRVRLRRKMLGLSQEQLGDALGISYQQVQKCERGANRIGPSRLIEMARVLDVPVTFFFDDVDPVRAPAIPEGFAEPTAVGHDPLSQPETIELVAAYFEITDTKSRRCLLELVKALANTDKRPIAAAPDRTPSTHADRTHVTEPPV